MVIAGGAQLPGKTMLLTALIDFIPPWYEKVFVCGRDEDFSSLEETDPATTYIVSSAIGGQGLDGLWGGAVPALFRTLDKGCSFVSTMDADSPEEVIAALENAVPKIPAGLIGGLFTSAAIPTWYVTLEKPPFTPPNWLFAPAWTLLYLLMGIAVFLVWRRGWESRPVRIAIVVFVVQLVLNVLWSVAFFGWESPLSGVIVIVALWAVILLTMVLFLRITSTAGWLLVPYLLWVSFAAVLNIAIWQLNP